LKLYEVYTEILNEVGEGTSKPFPLTYKPTVTIELSRLANIGKKHPGTEEKPWAAELSFFYDFENDKGYKYKVNFMGWAGVSDSYYSQGLRRALGGDKDTEPEEVTFDSAYNVSFDVHGGREEETNFQEQYRVLATVVQCVRDFVEQADKTPIPVKQLDIVPKVGEDEEKGMDSKRGRFYLAYIKKQVKTLPGDWSVTKMYSEGGVSIKRGNWRGGGVIDVDN
jgi:hypothetical protein